MTVLYTIAATATITMAVSDKIEQNIAKFKSSDFSAQYVAVDAFEEIAVKEGMDSLRTQLNRKELEIYLERWPGNSDKTALLLGRLGDKDSAPILRKMRNEAKEIPGSVTAFAATEIFIRKCS